MRHFAVAASECCFFFFQAEDGIRDIGVTGVQTCALPISLCHATARDVVLGWERNAEFYVGIDSRRLTEGGQSHNASTFVSLTGIEQAPSPDGILVMPRPSDLFSAEYQAYFRPRALAEYLMNVNRIHRG